MDLVGLRLEHDMRFFYNKDGFAYVDEDSEITDYLLSNSIELPEYYVKFLMERQGEYCTIKTRDNGLPYLEYDDPHIHTSRIRKEVEDSVRSPRNQKLSACDWTQMPDIPEHIREPYKEYRQKLRDVPQQKGFPHAVIWPKEPNTKKEP